MEDKCAETSIFHVSPFWLLVFSRVLSLACSVFTCPSLCSLSLSFMQCLCSLPFLSVFSYANLLCFSRLFFYFSSFSFLVRYEANLVVTLCGQLRRHQQTTRCASSRTFKVRKDEMPCMYKNASLGKTNFEFERAKNRSIYQLSLKQTISYYVGQVVTDLFVFCYYYLNCELMMCELYQLMNNQMQFFGSLILTLTLIHFYLGIVSLVAGGSSIMDFGVDNYLSMKFQIFLFHFNF